MRNKVSVSIFFLTYFISTFQIIGMCYLPQAKMPIAPKIHKIALLPQANYSQSAPKHPSKNYLSYLPDDSLVKRELEKQKTWLIPFWKSKHRKAGEHIMEYLEANDKEVVRFGHSGLSNILAFLSMAVNSSSMESAIRTILENKNISDEIIRKEKDYISSAGYKIETARKKQLEQDKKNREEKAKTKL